jgi:tRNA-dihydrouridine synthase
MTLLSDIDVYLQRTGVAETTFGRRAVNDPRLVRDLRRGRVPGPALCARIEAILSARAS